MRQKTKTLMQQLVRNRQVVKHRKNLADFYRAGRKPSGTFWAGKMGTGPIK